MKALPAIDLREGAVVQLVGGSYTEEKVRLPDPLAVARQFTEAGFDTAHVVDLDAALGKGHNDTVIARLCKDTRLALQVGGGVRDDARVKALLDAGVERVVIGTRAIEDRGFRERVALAYPKRVIIAADVRGRRVLTRGWQEQSALQLSDLLEQLKELPLAGVLITAVHVEGSLQGPDLSLYEERGVHPIIASGGIASMEDLRALQSLGVDAAVLGMALYTGALDAREVAKEFA